MQLPGPYRPFRIALAASCAVLLFAATPMMAQQATGAGVAAEAGTGVRAVPLPGAADHVGLLLSTLSAARSAPTVARPAADRPAEASAPLTGPRVRHDIRGVEPRLAGDHAPAPSAAPPANNTIVISTLALVLIAVIITILVVD